AEPQEPEQDPGEVNPAWPGSQLVEVRARDNPAKYADALRQREVTKRVDSLHRAPSRSARTRAWTGSVGRRRRRRSSPGQSRYPRPRPAASPWAQTRLRAPSATAAARSPAGSAARAQTRRRPASDRGRGRAAQLG